MKTKIIILFIILINLYGCANKSDTEDSLGTFDISKDDKNILFSYKKDDKSSIYIMNNDGTDIKIILQSEIGKNFINPRYSNDNKKILFIESSNSEEKNSSLCIANPDGSSLLKIVDGFGIITEAFFSPNDNEIIFCKANDYKNYSPIGRKASHDFDIYSINLNNKKLLKLTNLNAYAINHLTEIEGKITFNINSKSHNGVFTISNQSIVPFIPKIKFQSKKTLTNSPFLFIPEKKEIIYVDSYDLFKMDIKTQKTTFLLKSDFGIVSLMRKFNHSNKILCSVQNDTNLYFVENNVFSKNVIPINL